MPNAQESAGFDLRTHIFDKRGRLTGKNPYRLHVRNGERLFERPVGSGNLWYENGDPAGRVEVTISADARTQTKKFHIGAEHKAYTAPLTGAEKLHFEHEELKAKTAAMEAELAAIRAEREAQSSQKQEEKVAAKPVAQETTTVKAQTVKTAPAPAPENSAKPAANYGELL